MCWWNLQTMWKSLTLAWPDFWKGMKRSIMLMGGRWVLNMCGNESAKLWQTSWSYSLGQCVPVGLFSVWESLSGWAKPCAVKAHIKAAHFLHSELLQALKCNCTSSFHTQNQIFFHVLQFVSCFEYLGSTSDGCSGVSIPAQPLSLASIHLNNVQSRFPRQVIFVKTKGKASEHENLALWSHWKSLHVLCLASTTPTPCWMPGP